MSKIKIGYLRFNGHVELDYDNSSVRLRGTDIRFGLFEAWHNLGYRVTVYSPYKKFIEDVYSRYPFIRSIRFSDGFPVDEDVLFIECAPTNTRFSYIDKSRSRPIIDRTLEVINNFCGNVIYHQEDIKYAFPFGECFRVTDSTNPINLNNIMQKYDMFYNKKWKILMHADTQRYLEYCEHRRNAYRKVVREYGVRLQSIPLCYGEITDKRLLPSRVPEYDCVHVGSEKTSFRTRRLKQIADEVKVNFALYGNWRESVVFNFKNIKYKGIVNGHGNVYKLYNNAYAGLQVTDKEIAVVKHLVSRIVQVIRAGAILICDKYDEAACEYGYGVEDSKEFAEMISYLKGLSYDSRLDMNIKQHSKLKKWEDLDWEKILLA